MTFAIKQSILGRIFLMIFTALILVGTAIAQESTAPERMVSEALLAELDLLEQFTQETRGLEEIGEFQIVFPTRADLADYLEVALAEELTPEIIAEEMAFYSAFDFMPRDFDLYAEYESLYLAQIAGFYDPETKDMNVLVLTRDELGDELPLLEQIIYVHEYVHTLQDMNFDLAGYLDANLDMTNDEALARLSLVEGDASYVMNLFSVFIAQENPLGTAMELLMSGMQVGGLTLPAGTPDILGAELLFPYEAGADFVADLRDEQGWTTVNNAYSTPPISTEQVMHPEKYITGEMPQDVSLVDVSAELGANWFVANEGRMGEFYLQQYLATQLSGADSRRAAAGWGGDAFTIYETDNADQAWVLRLVWDSAEEEAEFKAAYEEFAAERFEESTSESSCWTDNMQVTCLSESGTTIATAPTLEMALLLLENSGI